MGFVSEFKEFISKGNVLDLAIGVIIGAAFGKIVTSLVDDILMPPIGLAIGGVDFKDIKVPLREAVNGAEAVTMNVGNFIQNVVDFLIIAVIIFMIIKAINRMKRPQQVEVVNDVPAPPAREVVLLEEIRDALRARA